jgi:hypothetical protein
MRKHIISLIGQHRKPDSWVEDEIEIASETERTHRLWKLLLGSQQCSAELTDIPAAAKLPQVGPESLIQDRKMW